jgi:hypothetical protein
MDAPAARGAAPICEDCIEWMLASAFKAIAREFSSSPRRVDL